MSWQAVILFALFFADKAPDKPAPRDSVGIRMHNVDFRIDRDSVLQIRSLRGEMIATSGIKPVTFDDKESFVTNIDSGEIAISGTSLASLLNKHVFGYAGAPLKRLSVSTVGDRIKLTGEMHKGIDLPFELIGTLAATPEGQIRIHADKIESVHLPVKGLMHLFGQDLSKLINLKEAQGVKVAGDDIIMFPSRIIPPPRIQGKVVSVRVEGPNIVQVFGSDHAPKELAPPPKADNYIFHRGGTLRFGKLTMSDADLAIVDADPRNPFEFYLDKYNVQLVAGYSKTTRSGGLVVFMPDYTQAATGDRHVSPAQ